MILPISASNLNHDLEKNNKWTNQCKMTLNPEPNKQAVEVLFSKKINSANHPPLFFHGSTVSKVNEHKHLILTQNCHLSVIPMKKSIKLKILSVFSSIFLNALKTLDQIFIRPHSDTPHLTNLFEPSITLNTLMERVEKIQYQAALPFT